MIDPTKLNYILRGCVGIYYIIQERLTEGIIMTNEEKVQHWVNMANYDIESADVMMKSKRNLYVGFICHLTVEKMLKAYFVKITEETPPYIHNLRLLAEKTDIYSMMSEEQKDFLNELNPLQIEARYQEYKSAIEKKLTDKATQEILTKTKEMMAWIKSKI